MHALPLLTYVASFKLFYHIINIFYKRSEPLHQLHLQILLLCVSVCGQYGNISDAQRFSVDSVSLISVKSRRPKQSILPITFQTIWVNVGPKSRIWGRWNKHPRWEGYFSFGAILFTLIRVKEKNGLFSSGDLLGGDYRGREIGVKGAELPSEKDCAISPS